WAFTVNHAALVPEGIDGFLDQLGLARCEEVRLADSHGRYEEHLPPGEGQIDFRQLFRRIEQDPQFHGHYMCAFGSLEVMLTGRAYLSQRAAPALACASPRVSRPHHEQNETIALVRIIENGLTSGNRSACRLYALAR